jgi:hypothetical protein
MALNLGLYKSKDVASLDDELLSEGSDPYRQLHMGYCRHRYAVSPFAFSSNQKAIAAVEEYFTDFRKNHYRDGIMALEHRWNKCIS